MCLHSPLPFLSSALCRINKKQAWDYVEPKYNREKAQLSPAEEERARPDNKQYSFTPKVRACSAFSGV